MGMYDRPWYREDPRGGGMRRPMSAVKILIIANVAVFLLQLITRKGPGWEPVSGGFGLYPEQVVTQFRVWQILTSMFLHGGPVHLLINMFVLFMFGTAVEGRLGRRQFFYLYFGAGILAGVSYVVVYHFMNVNTPAVGASGGIVGVVIYYALLAPNSVAYIFGLIPMRMKWVAIGLVGLDLFGFFAGGGRSEIANVAHLGGALFGFLYFRYANRLDRMFVDRQVRARTNRASRDLRGLEEMREEVDRLLGKVSRGGLDSLSEEEKRFLTDASRRLRREGR